MRIECPDCEAAYEVPDAQIRPGRSVRCVRCDLQWRPAGELPGAPSGPETPERAEQQPAPAGGGGSPVRLRRSAAPPAPLAPPVADPGAGSGRHRLTAWISRAWRHPGWGAGWAASLIVMAGLLASAAYWRTAIMQDWPPSIRLYTALGVPPPQT